MSLSLGFLISHKENLETSRELLFISTPHVPLPRFLKLTQGKPGDERRAYFTTTFLVSISEGGRRESLIPSRIFPPDVGVKVGQPKLATVVWRLSLLPLKMMMMAKVALLFLLLCKVLLAFLLFVSARLVVVTGGGNAGVNVGVGATDN